MSKYQKLLEEVSQHNRVDLPHSLSHPVERRYAKQYRRIEATLEQYHRSNDVADLREALRLALRQIETMDDDIIRLNLEHEHEKRRANHKLASIKQIKKERDADEEI